MFSPAKVNLFLAVTGRRPDGFHDLVSLAAPLDFGDTLHVEAAGGFSLSCDDPEVPADGSNLVLRAAHAFAEATGWPGGARFRLEKWIPAGAGLGGGSSNAVAALRALNRMSGNLLDGGGMAKLAAAVGSDCPLFLAGGPVVMRGRGERIEPLPPAVADWIRGRRLLIFKPGFGVATPWAYARLAAMPHGGCLAAAEAEARLAAWCGDPDAPLDQLLFNALEAPVFASFLALPALLERLVAQFGIRARMSGSGSACFALMPADADGAAVVEAIRDAWGPTAFVVEARLA